MKKVISLIILVSLLTLSVSCGGKGNLEEQTEGESSSASLTSEAPAVDNHVNVVILSGQSNAVGYTVFQFLDGATREKYSYDIKNVFIMNSVNPYIAGEARASKKFVRAKPGMGVYSHNFGPELGMAEVFSEAFPDENTYIIKDATGGSCLCTDWVKGDGNGQLLSHLLYYIGEGLNELEDKGLEPRIVGFCWMQGETDSGSDFWMDNYNNRFSRLITEIENRFGDYIYSGGMAVVQAGISSYRQNRARMNAIKKEYTESHENAYYFDTYDLSYDRDNDDYAHYDAVAMAELGRRFGRAVVGHLEKQG